MPPEQAASVVGGGVVHVVGLMCDDVFSFVGPATRALQRAGREQILIMIDEPRYRLYLLGLAEPINLVVAPRFRNPLRQWTVMLAACRKTLAGKTVAAVHLHGVLPALVGLLALWSLGQSASIVFSPHASRSLLILRTISKPARPLVQRFFKRWRHAVVVNVPWETTNFSAWKQANLVENPVPEVFFTTERSEAPYPLILTGGRDQNVRNAHFFAQLAVLLSSNDLKIRFNWIGVVDPTTQQRLNAAGIAVFDSPLDSEWALRLAAGWAYLAPSSTRGFPVFLVRAMAVGLPCVVLDCIQHREIIVDGVNGYLCRTDRQMIESLAALIDSMDLRHRIGHAARMSVRERFAEAAFATKLLNAYNFHE